MNSYCINSDRQETIAQDLLEDIRSKVPGIFPPASSSLAFSMQFAQASGQLLWVGGV
jgi:hypothetical protein